MRDLNFLLPVLFKKTMKFGWFLKTLFHFQTVLFSDIHPIAFLAGSLLHFLISSKSRILSYKSCPHKGQFSSVTQSCPTLCNPMDYSTPGFPVHHQIWSLLKNMSTESVMPSNHLILCRPLPIPPSVFPSIRVFSSQSVLQSGGQSIGVSASASVLPMNIQDWSPLGLITLIPQSNGLSKVFSNNTVQRHQFFGAQLSL